MSVSFLNNLQRRLYPKWHTKILPTRFLLSFLTFFGLCNIYTLRNAINVAIMKMQNHYGWDEIKTAWVLGCFYIPYIVMNFFGGRLSELYGGQRILGLGIVITSLLTLLTKVASDIGYPALICLRLLEGVSEGMAVPAMFTIFGRWFPKSERTFLRAICMIGFDAGYIIGNPVTAYLSRTDFLGGWPSVFYVFGTAGVVWYMFWSVLVYETPADHPFITEHELKYILDDQGEESAHKSPPAPWYDIWTSVPFWALLICGIISGTFTEFIRTDLNIFLQDVFDFTLEQNGWWSILPSIIDLVSGLIFGWLGDYCIAKSPTNRRTFVRKSFNFACMIVTLLFTIGVIFAGKNAILVLVLLSLSYGLGSIDTTGGSGGSVVDMSPVFAGSIYGILNGIWNINGLVAPILVGYITEGRKSDLNAWNIVFYLSIVTNVLSTIIYIAFGTSDLQPWGVVKEGRKRNVRPLRFLKRVFLKRDDYKIDNTNMVELNVKSHINALEPRRVSTEVSRSDGHQDTFVADYGTNISVPPQNRKE